jgi:HlyD family secretion protein
MTANVDRGLKARGLVSVVALTLIVLGGAGWGATADLSGAIIARGTLVTEGNQKKVQHLTGGIVGEILVANGQRVSPGDVLLRLDDAQANAQYAIFESRLRQLVTEQARLVSERDDASAIVFPSELRLTDPRAQAAMIAEDRLFLARRAARMASIGRLNERRVQIEMQLSSLLANETAKSRELAMILADLDIIEGLWRRNLTTMARVTAARRERARYDGELAALQGHRGQAMAMLAETAQQQAEFDLRWRSEVQRELRDVSARIAETEERLAASKDQLKRIELRAPVAGIVHELGQHTVGGIVKPGETAMSIVPSDAKLVVEARVGPNDIDQIRQGQSSLLRFSSLSQRTTPIVRGSVAHVAADLSRDQTGGFYTARIEIVDTSSIGVALVAGMPVEAFIETGTRTAWSYLLKPISDGLARAFREQ